MWLSFCVAAILVIVFFAVPGLLFFRALRFGWCASACLAPVFSIACYGVLCVLFGMGGIACSWTSVFGAAVGIGVLACLVSALAARAAWGKTPAAWLREAQSDAAACSVRWRDVFLYVAVACVAVGLIFVRNLDGADSFAQTIDSAFHYGTVRAFIDSGNWSSLGASPFTGQEALAPAYLSSTAFYPAAWHDVVALVVSALDVSVPLGANAVNTALLIYVYPCAMYYVMRVLFKDSHGPVLCGAIVIFCFTAFPWRFTYWGVLYPNLLANCIVLAVAVLFSQIFEEGASRGARVRHVFAFAVGVVALALAQTGAVFTAALFMIPFCVHRVGLACDARFSSSRGAIPKKLLAMAGFVLFAIGCWAVIFNLPALEFTVDFTWPAIMGKKQALLNVALLSYRNLPFQVVLALVLVAGVFVALRNRRYRWMAAAYVLAALMFVVNASTDGFLKHFLNGFWYTDHNRVAANAVLFAMSLAALGLSAALQKVQQLVKSRICRDRVWGRAPRVAAYALPALAFTVLVFYPGYSVPGMEATGASAFEDTQASIARVYSASDSSVYSPEERAFIDRVKSVVPEGEVVLNNPNDGSFFGYGINGANVFYRNLGYSAEMEKPEAYALRTGLCTIATDDEVRRAAVELHISYVLQLDHFDFEQQHPYIDHFDPSAWAGIDLIGDDTEGFEVVLAEGDMRLYKIDDALLTNEQASS